MTHDAMSLFGVHKDQTMPTHFIKLTEQTFGEIIINTSAITFISIDKRKICVSNTNAATGSGMLELTKDSMTKLLHCIDYD